MGFPSNDFNQEDRRQQEDRRAVLQHLRREVPDVRQVAVRGKDAHPLFAQLTQATGKAPGWNFNKYLVGRDGKPVAHYGSTTWNPQQGAWWRRSRRRWPS
jgi:glutathione peroxidase